MHIIAFGASTSQQSINKRFARHTLTHFQEYTHELIDLNDYAMPLFSVDLERENGYPEAAQQLLDKIATADLLVISMAEHNGNYTAAFKNTLDWCSRINGNVFQEKPLFLISTSPGRFGAQFSLGAAVTRFPRHSARILETFSLPQFEINFDEQNGITEEKLRNEYLEKIRSVKRQMNNER